MKSKFCLTIAVMMAGLLPALQSTVSAASPPGEHAAAMELPAESLHKLTDQELLILLSKGIKPA